MLQESGRGCYSVARLVHVANHGGWITTMDSVIALADLQSIYSVAEVDRAARERRSPAQ